MARDAIPKEIQTLDPEKDHERIVFLSTCYEFPFDTTRALEMAMFHTFCVPKLNMSFVWASMNRAEHLR